MMTFLFLLFLAAMVVAWRGRRVASLWIFAGALVLSAYWLHHHATIWPNVSL